MRSLRPGRGWVEKEETVLEGFEPAWEVKLTMGEGRVDLRDGEG